MSGNKKSALKWLAVNSRSVAAAVALLTVTGIAVAYVSTRFAVAAMYLLDSVTGKSQKSFSECVINLAALLALQLLLQMFYTLYDVRVRTEYKNLLQKNLFYTIITRDYLSISKIHSGELINRLTSDIETVYSNVIDIIPGTATLVSGVVFSFFTMLRLDWQLSLICLALGPVVMVCSAVYGRKMKGLYKDCRKSDGKIRSFMQECIQNIIAVKSFCSEKKSLAVARKLQHENYKLNMKRGYISILVNIMYYLALTAAYYFAVAWCAYKIKAGIMTVGAFTAIVQLVGQIQSPFRDVASVIPKYYATCASAERIMEIEGISSDEDSGTSAKLPSESEFVKISADGVNFSYGDEPVLRDVSFEVKKGEIAVLQGLSGIGKSTLLKIILGIIKPTGGAVTLDFKDLRLPADGGARGLFAYVPQGNLILSGSIRKNIAFFDDSADDEKIISAAKNACIWDFICSLPDGLDTEIGENGAGLSEGQVQRIAIARALYRGAPVILLDEATSALDESTEAQVLENIRKMKSKTCIIITHKDAALKICDKFLKLSNGVLEIK